MEVVYGLHTISRIASSCSIIAAELEDSETLFSGTSVELAAIA